jgi:hypothetical protein
MRFIYAALIASFLAIGNASISTDGEDQVVPTDDEQGDQQVSENEVTESDDAEQTIV